MTTERAIQIIECMITDLTGGVWAGNKVAIMRYDALEMALSALEEKLKKRRKE